MSASLPEPMLAIIIAPFVGSFLSVLAIRLPEKAPVVFARSACPQCGRRLSIGELVPVFGWLAARARCHSCGNRISAFYPFMELGALAIAVWAASVVSPGVLWPSCLLGWTLLALAAMDARTMTLSDTLTLPLMIAGLVFSLFNGKSAFVDALLGAAIGFLAFVAIAWIYRKLRRRDGLGLGDAKLLAASGAWTGWAALPSVVGISAMFGLAAAVLIARNTRISADVAIPYGPFICAATWLVWLYGPLVPE